jgi:hypothetical protein
MAGLVLRHRPKTNRDGASPVNTLVILNDPPYDTERVYVD